MLNAPVAIECGTINKLPIIKTSKYYDAWIAAHMEVMLKDESLEVRCGFADTLVSYGYYDDILDTQEINFWDLTPDSIIENLKCEINQGHYIIIGVLRRNYKSYLYVHSHVLYG